MTAPQPDTRTPGQVLCEALMPAVESRWPGLSESYRARYDDAAATLRAHDAALRAARGEVVVDLCDLADAMAHLPMDRPEHAAVIRMRHVARAGVAAPTPKETDR